MDFIVHFKKMENNKTDNNTILIFEFIDNEIIHTKQMLNKI